MKRQQKRNMVKTTAKIVKDTIQPRIIHFDEFVINGGKLEDKICEAIKNRTN